MPGPERTLTYSTSTGTATFASKALTTGVADARTVTSIVDDLGLPVGSGRKPSASNVTSGLNVGGGCLVLGDPRCARMPGILIMAQAIRGTRINNHVVVWLFRRP